MCSGRLAMKKVQPGNSNQTTNCCLRRHSVGARTSSDTKHSRTVPRRERPVAGYAVLPESRIAHMTARKINIGKTYLFAAMLRPPKHLQRCVGAAFLRQPVHNVLVNGWRQLSRRQLKCAKCLCTTDSTAGSKSLGRICGKFRKHQWTNKQDRPSGQGRQGGQL